MAKKNMQLPTPENYIRSRSRKLPVYECMVNSGWEEAKMANIMISRKHSNGNITYCMYLVDLFLLGVKNTHFEFNISPAAYKARVLDLIEDHHFIPIDYTLAHNVILAGVEFAETYEFKPYKDFTSVTQYFLEEDTDDIPLMQIDTGNSQGEPFYMYNESLDNPRDVARIIAQLERTAGPGNYSVMQKDEPSGDDIFGDDDEFYDDYEDDGDFEDAEYADEDEKPI